MRHYKEPLGWRYKWTNSQVVRVEPKDMSVPFTLAIRIMSGLVQITSEDRSGLTCIHNEDLVASNINENL